MGDVEGAVDAILGARKSLPARRSVLVAITGIDGCGKGVVTARVANALHALSVRAAAIHADAFEATLNCQGSKGGARAAPPARRSAHDA